MKRKREQGTLVLCPYPGVNLARFQYRTDARALKELRFWLLETWLSPEGLWLSVSVKVAVSEEVSVFFVNII